MQISQTSLTFRLSNFHSHDLWQKSNMPKSIHGNYHKLLNQLGQKMVNCQSSFYLSFFQGQLRTAKAFLFSLYINQLHLIQCRCVISLFYRGSKYSDKTFSSHSVARFAVGSHFESICACSEGAHHVDSFPRPATSTRSIKAGALWSLAQALRSQFGMARTLLTLNSRLGVFLKLPS